MRQQVHANRGAVWYYRIRESEIRPSDLLHFANGIRNFQSRLFAHILCSPGATLMHTTTRKAPNAFHFRRQIQILEKAGGGGVEQQFQDIVFVSVWGGSFFAMNCVVIARQGNSFGWKPFWRSPSFPCLTGLAQGHRCGQILRHWPT